MDHGLPHGCESHVLSQIAHSWWAGPSLEPAGRHEGTLETAPFRSPSGESQIWPVTPAALHRIVVCPSSVCVWFSHVTLDIEDSSLCVLSPRGVSHKASAKSVVSAVPLRLKAWGPAARSAPSPGPPPPALPSSRISPWEGGSFCPRRPPLVSGCSLTAQDGPTPRGACTSKNLEQGCREQRSDKPPGTRGDPK